MVTSFSGLFRDLFGAASRPGALGGALVVGDELSFSEQHLAERGQHVEQQVELAQTLASRAPGAEKELELNPATTIGNRHHVVAPLVFTTTTRFDFREYV